MLRTLTRKYLLLNITTKRYAGHSKWQNIRHIKGAKDAERNVLFTKLSRQIKVAVQEGGSDPNKNNKLYQVLEQCKRFNMPAATMQSVLKSCQFDKSNAKSYMIEIKGPGSSIILCEAFTDHIHALKQNKIAPLLKKHQSKFSDGGAAHLFHEKGIIEAENSILSSKPKEEQLELATEHAIESDSEDVIILDDDLFQFVCSKQNFPKTQTLLEKLGYKILNASVDYIPLKAQEVGPSDMALYEKLMIKLEEMPEIIRLFDNVSGS